MGLIEVKLRPIGPWRSGHRAGDRERIDVIYHSDALYSAITHAMRVLGWMEPWLDATARSSEPAVRFSSLFPFVGKTRLITPPKQGGMRLIPLELARSGAAFDKSRWQADVPSECLLPQGAQPPFQVSLRSAAAVDRVTGAVEPHRIACLEFAANSGWWGVFDATPEWEPKVKSAFRLLADSGFGGERSRGWGRAGDPTFSTATALFPDRAPNGNWWVLGLFSPDSSDQIDWAKSEHTITIRGGWTDSPVGAGPKKQLRMVEEGAVLSAPFLKGRAVDVSPDGFPHPVYRNGQPLAMPLPVAGQASGPEPVLSPEPEFAEPSEHAPHDFPEPKEPEPESPEPVSEPAPEPPPEPSQDLSSEDSQ